MKALNPFTISLPYVMEHKTSNFYTGYLISMHLFHYIFHILSDLFASSLLCCSFLIKRPEDISRRLFQISGVIDQSLRRHTTNVYLCCCQKTFLILQEEL
jgi:hypothetical protein